MKKLLLVLLVTLSYSNNLDNLLTEYKNNSNMSSKTVDENIGHLRVYTHDDIKKMQYNKLSDLLKELRLLNFETSQYGTKTLLNTGFKASVSTSVKMFINNHEVSSLFTQSPFSLWEDLPLDFISHIEVYNGISNFSIGSEPGVNYIKIFTLDPKQLNGTKLNTVVSDTKNRSMGITQSALLENDWSYLFYGGVQRNIYERTYNGSTLYNNATKRYLFLNLNKETSKVDLAYTTLNKDNFMGYSLDSVPDDGELNSKDFYISYSDSFLYDNSLKTVLSYDFNDRYYTEKNDSGIAFISNLGPTLVSDIKYQEDFTIEKYNIHLTKSFESTNNDLLIGTDYILKQRDSNLRKVNDTNVVFNNFNTETTLSIFAEDKYKVSDELYLSANVKFDKFIREDVDNLEEKLLRAGAIYMPTSNLGFKMFVAKTYIPPTFFYQDYADTTKGSLDSQDLKYASLENVFTYENHKFSLTFARVITNNMIILGSSGFSNIDDEVVGDSFLINYDYKINEDDKLEVSYYETDTNQPNSNSVAGGYIKYMGSYLDFDYFTSLIYKEGYIFRDLPIKNGYDLSLGTTYNFSKNLSLSLKAENILDKAIKNSYYNYIQGKAFTLENQQKSFTASIEWVF